MCCGVFTSLPRANSYNYSRVMFRLSIMAGRLSRLPPVWEALHFSPAAFSGSAPVTVTQSQGKHTLPDLDYDYDALEPHISAEIMRLHHCKHHATYVNNLNVAEEKLYEATNKSKAVLFYLHHYVLFTGNVNAMIALQPAVKFNGGGHINHSIFWTNLTPNCTGGPSGRYIHVKYHYIA